MHLLVNTGGGDAPGLNAATRAVTLAAVRRGFRVTGVRRGYSGLLNGDGMVELTRDTVRGVKNRGGTLLGTVNRGQPFEYPVVDERDRADRREHPRHGVLSEARSPALVRGSAWSRDGRRGDGPLRGMDRALFRSRRRRLLALRYGAAALRLAAEGRWGEMVSWQPPRMTSVPIQAALERTKRVPIHHDGLQTARDFGICLGE